jgi:serine/threonine protein phosphatase PrpC
VERPNEDGAALFPWDSGGVVIVADGVGGGPSGAKAARIALEAVVDSLTQSQEAGSEARAGILDGFESANREVLALGVGAATTLTAVELHDASARVYHVGDTEAALVGQRGKVKLQIVSHTPSGYGLEAGLLSAHEAVTHEERHIVLNLVGSQEMRIDVSPPMPMAPRDTLVVGSDGLFDNWRFEEIVERVRCGPLDQSAAALAQATQQRMTEPDSVPPAKPDDLTFALLRRHC